MTVAVVVAITVVKVEKIDFAALSSSNFEVMIMWFFVLFVFKTVRSNRITIFMAVLTVIVASMSVSIISFSPICYFLLCVHSRT